MRCSYLLSRLILLSLIVPGSAVSAQQQGDLITENYKAGTVRVTARFADGDSKEGFGFIVGERNRELLLVTANHVIEKKPDRATSIEVRFAADPDEPYLARWLQSKGHLHLAADLPWKRADLDIDARRIRVTNVQDLDAPGLGLKGPVSSLNLSAEVSQPGAAIQLRELSVSAGAQLSLHIPDYPRLDVKNGVLAVRIEANQVRLDFTDPDGSKDLPVRARCRRP